MQENHHVHLDLSQPHPVFQRFRREDWVVLPDNVRGGGDINFLGLHIPLRFDAVRLQGEYWSGRSSVHWPGEFSIPSPTHEDYFEYVDLLESIARAESVYRIAEVGAGYGRWILNAVHAIRRYRGHRLEPFCIGFEACPDRAALFRELMRVNSVRESAYLLVEKIVVSRSVQRVTEQLPFIINKNDPAKFGGAIVDDRRDIESGRVPISKENWVDVKLLPVCSLDVVCGDFGVIDFMNFDIQNAEIDVIPHSIKYLTDNVRMCHVGTHSYLADEIVSRTFLNAGWKPRWQFPWKSELETNYGVLKFRDGVFSYENPKKL